MRSVVDACAARCPTQIGAPLRFFAMRTGLALLFSVAAGLSAADKKIVINALDDHNRWAFTEQALGEYRNAGNGAAIVVAKSPADLAREVADADAVIGGISKDLFPK